MRIAGALQAKGAKCAERGASWHALHMSEPVLVVAFGGQVVGLDPVTGKIAWEYDLGGHTPRLLVTETQIFAAGHQLCCLAYPTGELIWKAEHYISRYATFVKSGDQLFTAVAGEVECYSALDGKPLWTNKFPGKGSDIVALGTPSNVMQAMRVG